MNLEENIGLFSFFMRNMILFDKKRHSSTFLYGLISSTYFYMWKGGCVYMNNYIVNDDVLCFTSVNDGNETFLIERDNEINLDVNSFELIKRSCKFYGNSYKIQRQFIIDVFNYYIKTPIVISPYCMLIFFPTTAPNSNKCIWISYNNIDRYVKEDGFTRIYFSGGKEINIDVSYATIDSQITKCIKIEKYLKCIMRKALDK